jgi:DNA-binding NarL/FixJ family response regulator
MHILGNIASPARAAVHTIAICDTEPVAVEGLRSLLETADWLRVVAADSSLEDSMESVCDLHPGIVIVEKTLGLGAVVDWIAALRAADSPPAVVVWSALLSESESLRLLQAGASGVIRKTASLDATLACLRAVARGETWVQDYMFPSADAPAHSWNPRLTSRELQVLALVEHGMRNKDIAQALGISAGTVKIHLKHIFEKSGIHGRYGLAVSALKDRGAAGAGAVQVV